MLGNMISVVGGIENIRVVQHIIIVQCLNQPLYHFIDGLQRSQSRSLILIVVFNNSVIQKG